MKMFNLFHTNVPFLNPLKTSEELKIFGIFRSNRNATLARYGLNTIKSSYQRYSMI